MTTGAWLSLGFVALAAWSCRDATARVTAKALEKESTRARAETSRLSPAQRSSIDPRAERVCDLLQREPAQRKAACCSSAQPSSAFEDCAHRLDRALEAGAVGIQDAVLEACTLASEAHYAGCDWVTPSQPLPPAACRALVVGKLAAGAACHSSLECVSPLHCKGATPSEPGRCASPEPAGAACHTSSDALAAALMIIDLDVSHPPCDGACSAVSRRCEPEPEAGMSTPVRKTRSAAAGEACENDFDCTEGGCVGEPKHCGMKCAISFAHGVKHSQPALALPHRTGLSSAR